MGICYSQFSDLSEIHARIADALVNNTPPTTAQEQLMKEDPYLELSLCVTDVWVIPIVCVLGLLLNISVILVFGSNYFKKRCVKVSTVLYLAALSVSDSLQLLLTPILVSLTALIVRVPPDFTAPLPFYAKLCFFCLRWLNPIIFMANYMSVWIMIVICLHRFFAICFRALGRQQSMRLLRKNSLVVSTLLLFSVALNFCRFWEYSLDRNGQIIAGPLTRNSGNKSVSPELYDLAMNGILYSVFVYFIPLVLLGLMNFRIIRAIRFASRVSKRNRISRAIVDQRERRSAFMVLTIIATFFVTHTLDMAVRWVHVLAETLVVNGQPFLLVHALGNLLVNVNSALNPLIYFYWTRHFNDLFNFEIPRPTLILNKVLRKSSEHESIITERDYQLENFQNELKTMNNKREIRHCHENVPLLALRKGNTTPKRRAENSRSNPGHKTSNGTYPNNSKNNS